MTPYYYMMNSNFEYSKFQFINDDYLNYGLLCLFWDADESNIQLQEITKEQYEFMISNQCEKHIQMRHYGKNVGTFTEIQGLPTTCNNWL
jgi:hypothetical protein